MKRISLAVTLCAIVALTGCEGTPTGKGEQARYSLFGLAEINLETEADYLYLKFLADGDPVAGSFAQVGNDTLHFDAAGTVHVSSPAVAWQYNTTVAVTVYDTAGDFAHTVTARMPSDVMFTSFIPTNHIYQGGNVLVEWAGTPGISGYLVTSMARTDDSPARGFAESYGEGVSTATIGPETFLNIYSSERVADTFYVYVTAYESSFYPRPGAKYTDTPEINLRDFPNTITGTNITGIFGAAVVSQREILDVVAQQ